MIDIKENKDSLEKILNSDILVYEELQGNRLFVNWNGKNWTFKPKSLSSQPLTQIDLTIQNYYIPAVQHFQLLGQEIKNLLNPKWWFCFEFFPCNQPANISYDEIPRNGLILTTIHKNINGKTLWVSNMDELSEYGRLLKTDLQPIIFQGRLNNDQKVAIRSFFATSPDDLQFLFGEENFAYYFYKVLNPYVDSSLLMSSTKYNDNIEKIIIKSKDHTITAAVLNPLYIKKSSSAGTEYHKTFNRIIADFLVNVQSINLTTIAVHEKTRQDMFLEIISQLFNQWALQGIGTALQWEFTIPEYMAEDRFKVNISTLTNPITKDIVKYSDKNAYCFKCVLMALSGKIDLKGEGMGNIGNFLTELKKDINTIIEKELDIKVALKKNREYPDRLDSTGKSYPQKPNFIRPIEVDTTKKQAY